MSSTISEFVTSDYEGISRAFTEISPITSRGYCDIFKAKRYGRWFLLKALKPQYADDLAYQQLLKKELDVLMLLQHHAVMQAYGMEEVTLTEGDRRPCLVAEWIDGTTLADFLHTSKEKARDTRRRIASELVDAVAYIHQQQVVHRDLKPSNIMVTHNGCNVKIIDFGLADTDSHAILKQPAGTLRYMAPEQADTTTPDTRNDIYSLGIILQELNLGGRAYRRIAEQCLRPIERRYQNAEALKKDLDKAARKTSRNIFFIISALIILAAMIFFIRGLRQRAQRLEQEAAEMAVRMKILNHELIDFEDSHVAAKCVNLWDTDNDGYLSPQEAQAVTTLGNAFTNDPMVTTFNELRFFTGLTEINADAFRDCSNLEAVTIPPTIRFIRKNAFRNTAVTTFSFPSTVAAVGDSILDDCRALQTVIFLSVPPNVNEGTRHFNNCPRLTNVFIPQYTYQYSFIPHAWEEVEHLMTDHIVFQDPEVEEVCLNHWDINRDRRFTIQEAQAVTELGNAFTRNPLIRHFTELRFFTALQAIDINAFMGCVKLEDVALPVTIKTIDDRAFCETPEMKHIDLPQHLEKIGNNAFAMSGIQSIHIPARVGTVGLHAFSCCKSLTTVTVSPENTTYDSRDNCNAIIHTATNTMVSGGTTATFPTSVKDISDEALVGEDREVFVIPPHIRHIGKWSFNFTVQHVYCMSPVPPAYDAQGGTGILFFMNEDAAAWNDLVIHVPIGSLQAYRQAEGWSYYATRMQEFPAPPVPNGPPPPPPIRRGAQWPNIFPPRGD